MMKRIEVLLPFIVLFAFLTLDGNTAPQTILWTAGINLIPTPQDVSLEGEDFLFVNGVNIKLDADSSEADKFAAADLAGRLKSDFGISATVGGTSGANSIFLTRKGASNRVGDQGYELMVMRQQISVKANGERGLFYGTRTLMQLIQHRSGGPFIRGMRIIDWPDIPQRAIHYDTKHHQDKAEYVWEFIRTLADYKINMLVWEWEDKFAYKSHPEIGAPGAFTMQEMQAFTRYARQYHITLTPLVQGLGHVSYILKWPQYAHLREIPASNWEFCPQKEGSYELLFDLWKEAMEATPGSEYIHIGTDETYELGQGVACGCRARMEEVGSYGLLLDFVNRCAQHLTAEGRKVISWGGEYRKDVEIRPPQGLIVSELGNDLDVARTSRDAGFPAWVYDPNPGIEHLFLPYFYRQRENNVETRNCLEDSYQTLTVAASSGLFDGMVCTSWDDSGLHNQNWMMRFILAADSSWNGKAPGLDEFVDKYFVNYYGSDAQDMRELWMLLNKGAYFYMDTFERKVWHWGDIGKTHLPDLPRGDAIEYNPFWNREYREIVQRAQVQLEAMQRARNLCRLNLELKVRHSYDFEIFTTIAELISHTARTYLALSALENAITEAHQQHFVDHQVAYSALKNATRIIETNLKEREQVFHGLVTVWEKTRLPKGLSTPEKKFFHQQDRARHFAFRQPDMTYLIYDEERLGLETYLESLRRYMDWYKKAYL